MILFRESLLRLRRAVGVDHALEIPREDRAVTDGLDESIQIHGHARLVTVSVGDDNAILIRAYFQDWPEGRIKLRIIQNDVFAMFDRVNHDPSAKFKLPSHLEDDINSF